MKLRVLLIKVRSLNSKVSAFTPPLGVMCLTSYLRKHLNADVRIANAALMEDPATGIASAVRSLDPHVVGLSGLTCESYMLHKAAGIVRSILDSVPIIAGGPYASSDPDRALADSNIDVAVMGEGEETFSELTSIISDTGTGWRNPRHLDGIRGIAFRGDQGHVQRTEPRMPIQDLDSLPLPAWDAIDLERYWRLRSMSTAGVRPYMTLFTSRGCPYKCTYCHNLFGKKFRSRTPASVIEEISELSNRYGIEDFEFLDDSININKRRFDGILSGMLDRNMHPMLHFPNGLRTDLLDETSIEMLNQVGAGEVSVAVETASPRLQKITGKRLDLVKVSRNIEHMARLRIFTRGFFMMGYPSETERELRETIGFAADSKLHLASFHIVNPFPGTAIHEDFKKAGKLLEDANSIDFEYSGAPFNGSDVPDELFHSLFKTAYLRFYLSPYRMLRILRDRPYLSGYAGDIKSFLLKLVSFRRLEEKM